MGRQSRGRARFDWRYAPAVRCSCSRRSARARSSCFSSRRPCRASKARARPTRPGVRNAARGEHARTPDADWPMYNRSYNGTRFSPLVQINAANVSSLAHACTFPLGVTANMQTGLVAVNGTVYFTTATDSYAIDATTCALRWRHTYDYDPKPPFDPNKVNRGVAYLAGPDRARLFRGANDGACDGARSRHRRGAVERDRRRPRRRTRHSPPRPSRGTGWCSSATRAATTSRVKGRLMAFDAKTGGRVWSFDLLPRGGKGGADAGPRERSAFRRPAAHRGPRTRSTRPRRSSTHRRATRRPISSCTRARVRNLYTYSVVGLDARLGTLDTFYQLLAQDYHDWDIAAAPSLVTTRRGAASVVAAGKDGHVYGTDRATGRRVVRDRRLDHREHRRSAHRQGRALLPGVNGGVEWNGPSYSPRTNLLYVGSIDWCTTLATYSADQPGGSRERRRFPGRVEQATRAFRCERLHAARMAHRHQCGQRHDQVALRIADTDHRRRHGDRRRRGVHRGSERKHFSRSTRRMAANSGATPRAHRSAAESFTYQVGGVEYLAVAVGIDSPIGWKLESPPATVLVFALRQR